MSKAQEKALKLFENQAKNSKFQEAFDVKESNQLLIFRHEFTLTPLTREEDMQIQHLLYEESTANIEAENQIEKDYKNLSSLITQIRAIHRQGVLLHGEKIHKAKEILKSYKERAFTRWLEVAYGNRQTPYRMLQYYYFFKSLDISIQPLLLSMPKAAAYVLASRDGDEKEKIKIIQESHSSSSKDIIRLVQETFPLKLKDRRGWKENDGFAIASMRFQLKKILKRKNKLNSDTVQKLNELRHLMNEILA